MIIPCCDNNEGCHSITWISTEFQALNEDYFSQQLYPLGVASPFKFYLVSGELPPGLSLSVNGLISGYPEENGDYLFVIQVSDKNKCSSSQLFEITVEFPVFRITEDGQFRITEGSLFRILE